VGAIAGFLRLGNFGPGGYPTGHFSIYDGDCSYEFEIAGYYEDVTWQEIRPVTNAVPFEVADGRTAWTGVHDAVLSRW
jgi:hypothetical protein